MPYAVQVGATGGPEVLDYVEIDQRSPGPGQVLVACSAAGVNYIDTYQRRGLYPRQVPFVLGLEGAGIVVAAGANVTGLSAGDRVCWCDTPGSYAEQVVVNEHSAVRIPDGLGDDIAAAAMLQGLTAHYLTVSTYPVGQGDSVLVHAAAGGVGLLLVQMAKARGARVIGTVSSMEKEALARGAGADEVIRYTEVDFAERIRDLTGGLGVAAVYDGVGRTTFDGSLASLRRRGTLALFGAASGPVPPLAPQRLNEAGSVFLSRPKLADHTATPEELRWRAGELFDSILSGTLRIRINGRYPLADARQAHEDLEGRKTTGKLLLIPG